MFSGRPVHSPETFESVKGPQVKDEKGAQLQEQVISASRMLTWNTNQRREDSPN
jgi:hypothetical protein